MEYPDKMDDSGGGMVYKIVGNFKTTSQLVVRHGYDSFIYNFEVNFKLFFKILLKTVILILDNFPIIGHSENLSW